MKKQHIIQANKENMNKILEVLDRNLMQAFADVTALSFFIKDELKSRGINYKGGFEM